MFQEQQSCRIISANPNQSGPNLSDVLRSRVDNMQEILATNGPLPMGGGGIGARTSPAQPGFLSATYYFSNFLRDDFHQIWLRHMNPCSLETYRKGFSKIFRFAPKKN